MKNLFLSFISCLVIFVLQAQTTINDANVELRNVSSFHGIEVSTGIELILTPGNEEVAVSAAKPEFRDKIITKVENGILILRYETKTGAVNRTKENKNLKAYVSFKSLDLLYVNTGAIVGINDILNTNFLDLKANTGAIVKGKINIGTLKVSQNTGSKIHFSGKVSKISIAGDTGSKFEGEDLNTSECNISVSTGAKVSVSADKELWIKANTGGIVKYKGNPPVRDIKVSTGGSVSKI